MFNTITVMMPASTIEIINRAKSSTGCHFDVNRYVIAIISCLLSVKYHGNCTCTLIAVPYGTGASFDSTSSQKELVPGIILLTRCPYPG